MYDQIGLEHFYLGNEEAAHYFHNRMNLAHLEQKDSDLRKLGLNKLREAETRAQLARTAFRAKISEIQEFDVVNYSSDEDFDIPYSESLGRNHVEQMIGSKWKFRLIPDAYELKRQKKQANINIRFANEDKVKKKIEPVEQIFDRVKKYAIQQKSYAKLLGFQKPKIMAHLTPNRNANMFQQLEETQKLRSQMGNEFSQGAYMLSQKDKETTEEEDLIKFKKNQQAKLCLETTRLSFEFARYFAQQLIKLAQNSIKKE